ncbi:carnitine dehydratase [Mycobacterium paraseoulense]|uniref:Carnitine dehydratase n=1 Tax=Mycobacterium paraseoulense TaxID=590652 RepID=A0A1X0IER1_9MYCO|nr:carnitine dehydratase [Mycobacterium paraseoulense]
MQEPLPLEGTTVVSVEQAVAAPFATRQLADLGARVIKIERPDGGDFARHYDETVLGQSSYFVWLNRSKESLTIDLKCAAGRAILEALLSKADVLVHNLGPGAAGRIDLDADAVARRHPNIIVCSISGYGAVGQDAQRKAYDLLVQGESGLLSLTGTPSSPAKVGISIADIAAGMYAFSGILTALLRRAKTGQAGPVEVSLFDAMAEWMGAPMYYSHYSGRQPARFGAQHATIAPYGPFETADGSILLAVQNEREWASFCRIVLALPELAHDERFASNSARVAHRDECNAIIADRLSKLKTIDALALLEEAAVATASINSVADLIAHRSLTQRHRWGEVDTPNGPIRALSPPATLSGVPVVLGPVPSLGQHTDSVLTELGYTSEQIVHLRTSRTV